MTHRRSARLVVVGVLGLVAAGCAGRTGGPPRGASRQSHETAALWNDFVWVALFVGLLVYGLIIWSVVRYRKRRDDDGSVPPQTHYNLPIEVFYTAVPIVVVAILFGLTVRGQTRIDHVAARAPARVVRVEGFQWGWRFTYLNDGVTVLGNTTSSDPELALPVGQDVRFLITSDDVIHSFFVPGFLFKRDAVPGQVNTVDMHPTTIGSYGGHCAEFCGLYHSRMNFHVAVMSGPDFDAWLVQHRTGASG